MLKTDKNKKSCQTFLKGHCPTLASLARSADGRCFLSTYFAITQAAPAPARGCNKTLMNGASCGNFSCRGAWGSSPQLLEALQFNSFPLSCPAAPISPLMFGSSPGPQLQMAVLHGTDKVPCHTNTGLETLTQCRALSAPF